MDTALNLNFDYPFRQEVELLQQCRIAFVTLIGILAFLAALVRTYRKGLSKALASLHILSKVWEYFKSFVIQFSSLLGEVLGMLSELTIRFFLSVLVPAALSVSLCILIVFESKFVLGYLAESGGNNWFPAISCGLLIASLLPFFEFWLIATIIGRKRTYIAFFDRDLASAFSAGVNADIVGALLWVGIVIPMTTLILMIAASRLGWPVQSAGYGWKSFLLLAIFPMSWVYRRLFSERLQLPLEEGELPNSQSIDFRTEEEQNAAARKGDQIPRWMLAILIAVCLSSILLWAAREASVPRAKASSILVLDGREDLGSRYFYSPTITVAADMNNAELDGHFVAVDFGGQPQKGLRFFLFPKERFESQFMRNSMGDGALSRGEEGDDGELDLKLTAIQPGDYVFVIQNGATNTVRVKGEVSLRYQSPSLLEHLFGAW